MDRRNFLKKSALAGAGLVASQTMLGKVMADNVTVGKDGKTLGSFLNGENTANGSDAAENSKRFEKRKLGKHTVTSIGLGCVDICPVGYYGCSTTKEDMLRLVRRAYDQGVTFFDTAEIYGMTVSEEWVGEALQPVRDKVTIETKFGFGVAENQPGTLNSKPEHIRKAVEGSLKRLRTDHLDMLYQHRVDPQVPIEEVAETVGQLIKEGKVLQWGLCEASAKTIRRAHAVQPLSAVESEYAIWWREPETKIFPTLEELGIDFVAYAPIGRGYLTGIHNENSRYVLPDRRAVLPRFEPEAMKHNMPLIRLVQHWAEQKGITPAQFAIAWVLSMRPYTLAIPGTTKYWHLDELVGAPQARLSKEELAQFNAELDKIDIMGHRANAAIESQIDK